MESKTHNYVAHQNRAIVSSQRRRCGLRGEKVISQSMVIKIY